MDEEARSRTGIVLAYTLSAATTLLWVACVLPSGALAPGLYEDLATPMHREAWLIVPALLLLVIGPVGVLLAQGRLGQLGVLAATDAFVALYAAIGLTWHGAIQGTVTAALVLLLYVLGLLSLLETGRLVLGRGGLFVAPSLKGARLALCLLVLLTPAWVLLREGTETASLMVPYALIAVSTAGARVSGTPRGLRLTSAVIHLVLAVHLGLTLRFAIFDGTPPLRQVGPVGWATLALALLVLLLALAQVVRLGVLVRRPPADADADADAAPSPPAPDPAVG